MYRNQSEVSLVEFIVVSVKDCWGFLVTKGNTCEDERSCDRDTVGAHIVKRDMRADFEQALAKEV